METLKRNMVPGRGEMVSLEHLIWVSLSDCLSSQEDCGALGGPGGGGRPALRIWKAGCWGHNEDTLSIFYIVVKC